MSKSQSIESVKRALAQLNEIDHPKRREIEDRLHRAFVSLRQMLSQQARELDEKSGELTAIKVRLSQVESVAAEGMEKNRKLAVLYEKLIRDFTGPLEPSIKAELERRFDLTCIQAARAAEELATSLQPTGMTKKQLRLCGSMTGGLIGSLVEMWGKHSQTIIEMYDRRVRQLALLLSAAIGEHGEIRLAHDHFFDAAMEIVVNEDGLVVRKSGKKGGHE